jgi:ABC-type bacteriocin/lantibiotic exporter with double-glycine peptidase domain
MKPWPSPLQDAEYSPTFSGNDMPTSLFGFVWRTSAWDQLWLSILSAIGVFLDTAPLEVQRRLLNATIPNGDFGAIGILVLVYGVLILTQGLVKLLMKIYRGWLSENAVRMLRTETNRLIYGNNPLQAGTKIRGVEVSLILSEAEQVGGFVGDSISEPLLSAGILVAVFGYMSYLQPTMTLITLAVFSPQFVFVPLMQRSINRRVRDRVATLRETSAGVIGDRLAEIASEVAQEARFAEVFRLNMGIIELKFTMNFLMNFTHHVGILSILGVGAWYVVHGRTEVGTVLAFISGLRSVNDPWGDLVTWFQSAMVTGARYKLILSGVAQISREGSDAPNN